MAAPAAPRVRFGLKHRLWIAMMLCAVVPGIWIVQNAQNKLSRRSVEEVRQVTEVVTLLVANMRATTDSAEQFERGMLSRFVRQVFYLFPNIAYLIVTDGNGEVQYGRVNPQLVQTPDGVPPMAVLKYLARPENGRGKNLSVVTVNLEAEGQLGSAGRIKAGYSLVKLQQALQQIRLQSVATLATIALLGFAASLWIARSMARPIERIARNMAAVGRGSLEIMEVTSNDELGVMERAYNTMVRDLREGQRIEDRFRRYVSPQIVDEIVKRQEQLHLAGERRFVTVLFADIRGFTSMSEVMQPDEVMAVCNEFFAAVTPVVLEEGGLLDKFIGDCIMAVWGAPLECNDQELRAVRCAMRMLDRVDQLNEERKKRAAAAIRVGIGINSGIAVAGNVGSTDRLAYTVIGDTVNVAQRLESLCREYPQAEIIVGETTYAKLRDDFSAEALPAITVKGRTQAIATYMMRRGSARRPELRAATARVDA